MALHTPRNGDLRLERELGTLDSFDVIILDDIGYVQRIGHSNHESARLVFKRAS